MNTSQLSKRIDKLTAAIRPNAPRNFTLEELCRTYWRMDRRGFRAQVAEMPIFRFFLDMFEREETEAAANRGGGAMSPNLDRETRGRRQRT
jgi:hypothetical protein